MADGSGRDGSDTGATRRRFLKATGAASVTAALAGCSGGDESGDTTTAAPTTSERPTTDRNATTDDGGTTARPTTTPPPASFEGYPYGIGESRIEDAKRAMETAGYGPNDRFELEWLTRRSPELWDLADTLGSWLAEAHIDVTFDQQLSAVELQYRRGAVDAFSYGWIPDYPAAENFLRLLDPPTTNYHREDADGAYAFWTEDSHHGEGRAVAAEQFDRIANDPEPTDEARAIRADAVRRMEEAIWNDVPVIPTVHGVHEPVWHDRVDWELPGALGRHRKRLDRVSVAGKDRLDLINGPMDTLDPVEATDRDEQAVVTNVFETLTNARNGTTTVDPLLIEEYETNDDFTRYTFTLKQGVQFHRDFGELTADDVAVSFKRLGLDSENAAYLTEVLGVEHEPADADTGGAKPGTVAVDATGQYALEVELSAPHPAPLAVLAHPAFSVIPKGIVTVNGPMIDGAMTQGDFAANPVGSGPYTVSEWRQDEEVVLDRFEEYHGDTPEMEQIRWAIVENAGASYQRFVTGQADVGVVPYRQYDRKRVTIDRTDARGRRIGTYGPLANGETVNFARIPGITTFYVGFNCERTPMPVRRAVAYVMNMEESVDDIYQGRALAAYHLTPPNLFPDGPDGYDQHYQG